MAQTTTPKIEELRFRLKTDPKNRLFYVLAEELRRIGQFAEAEQVLHGGIVHHPTYLSAWVSLGRVLREQKKDREAVDVLERAMQLDPGNVVAARLLADAWLALDEKLEALKRYKLVQALLPPDETLEAVITRLDREVNMAAIPLSEPEPEPDQEATPDPAHESGAATEPVSAGLLEGEPAASPGDAQLPVTEQADAASSPATNADAQTSPFLAGETEESVGDTAATEAEPEAAGDLPYLAPAPAASPFNSTWEDTAPQFPSPVVSNAFTSDEDEVAAPVADSNPWADEGTDQRPSADVDADAERQVETGDSEPMLEAHSTSPFEDAPAAYSADAFAIEQPEGMHIARAPFAADVPLVSEAESLAPVDAPLVASESSDSFSEASDVFAPAEESSTDDDAGSMGSATGDHEELTSTLTMADLYTRQGLTAEATHIYENILARDPGNAHVRSLLDGLQSAPAFEATSASEVPEDVEETTAAPGSREAKVAALSKWLNQVTRREARDVH